MDLDPGLGTAALRLSTEESALFEGMARAKKAAEDLETRFRKTGETVKGSFGDKLEHAGVFLFSRQLLDMVGLGGLAQHALGAISASAEGVAAAFGTTTSALAPMLLLVGVAIVAYEKLSSHLEKAAEAAAKQVEENFKLAKSFEVTITSLKEYSQLAGGLSPVLQALRQNSETAAASLGKVNAHALGVQMSSLQKLMDAQKKERDDLKEQIEWFNKQAEVGERMGNTTKGALDMYRANANALTVQLGALNAKMDENQAKFSEAKANATAIGKGFSGYSAEVEKNSKAIREDAEAHGKLIKMFDEQTQKVQESGQQFDEYSRKAEDRIESLRASLDTTELGQIAKHFSDVRAEIDREYEHQADVLERSKVDQETFNQRSSAMWQQRERAMTAVTQAEAAKRAQYYRSFFGAAESSTEILMAGTRAAVNQIATSWSAGFAALVVKGEQWKLTFLSAIQDVLTAFIQAMVEMEIRYLAFKALSGMGFLPSAPSGIPGRASGGDVMSGRPYWVGERGVPELFVPRQNGTIVPAEKLGGGERVQNFNFNGLDYSSAGHARKLARTLAGLARSGDPDVLGLSRVLGDQSNLTAGRAYA